MHRFVSVHAGIHIFIVLVCIKHMLLLYQEMRIKIICLYIKQGFHREFFLFSVSHYLAHMNLLKAPVCVGKVSSKYVFTTLRVSILNFGFYLWKVQGLDRIRLTLCAQCSTLQALQQGGVD